MPAASCSTGPAPAARACRSCFSKVVRTPEGLVESWISNDEFYKEYNSLIFQVPADLFIPAGGRPETVDGSNWQRFFDEAGAPRCRVIVEGANSFITPEARKQLQQRGRDPDARRLGQQMRGHFLILRDHRQSHALRRGISRPQGGVCRRCPGDPREAGGGGGPGDPRPAPRTRAGRCSTPRSPPRSVPRSTAATPGCSPISRPTPRSATGRSIAGRSSTICRRCWRGQGSPFRERVERLPDKIRSAILAGEIASSLVYHGDRDQAFLESVEGHLRRRQNLDYDSEMDRSGLQPAGIR